LPETGDQSLTWRRKADLCILLSFLSMKRRNPEMNARPHTTASKKRILRRKAGRRAGNKPQLGIPPGAKSKK
jgi:hypothetical protein